MKTLKIGYFADGPWAHEAFKKIIEDESIEIRFIVPRRDTKDNTLKNFSEQYNIAYLPNRKINSKEFIEEVKAYGCDLFVSMSFNQIFKNEIINLPPLKTINCHASKLPFYRGRNIINWVLINDEKELGITVHYMDEGIDTGDIILQRTYPITDRDNYSSLLNLAYKECANILYDSLKLIQNGNHRPIKQSEIHPTGFYCSQRKQGDEYIDWNWNTRRIFNFIRAINKPEGPGARTLLEDGEEVIINSAEHIKNAPNYIGVNGSILLKESGNLMVKTNDNIIKLTGYESNITIKPGMRFKR